MHKQMHAEYTLQRCCYLSYMYKINLNTHKHTFHAFTMHMHALHLPVYLVNTLYNVMWLIVSVLCCCCMRVTENYAVDAAVDKSTCEFCMQTVTRETIPTRRAIQKICILRSLV